MRYHKRLILVIVTTVGASTISNGIPSLTLADSELSTAGTDPFGDVAVFGNTLATEPIAKPVRGNRPSDLRRRRAGKLNPASTLGTPSVTQSFTADRSPQPYYSPNLRYGSPGPIGSVYGGLTGGNGGVQRYLPGDPSGGGSNVTESSPASGPSSIAVSSLLATAVVPGTGDSALAARSTFGVGLADGLLNPRGFEGPAILPVGGPVDRPAAVPEPSILAVLLPIVAMLRRRRSR